MLSIRLSQVGKKNKKMFRITVNERSRDTFGKSLEILGHYDPHSKEFKANAERAQHWISVGAQMTATVNNLFVKNGIVKGNVEKSVKVSKKRQEKINKESADKKKAEEAKKAAEVAVKEAAVVAAKAAADAEAEVANTAVVETEKVEAVVDDVKAE